MWQKLCKLEAVPANALQAMEIDGVPLLVVNGATRRLVIPRSCPHMSASLEEAAFDGHVLTCTKHLWQWSIDAGGEAVGEAETPLLCYETKEVDGELYCKVSQELRYEHEEDF